MDRVAELNVWYRRRPMALLQFIHYVKLVVLLLLLLVVFVDELFDGVVETIKGPCEFGAVVG